MHFHKSKRPSYFFGDRLNAFLKQDVIDNTKEYRICGNIYPLIKSVRVRRKQPANRGEKRPELTRDERAFSRRCQQSTFDANKLKKVTVSVNDGNDDEVVHYGRLTHEENYHDSIIKSASEYRKPFIKLKMRERRRRMEKMAINILSCCVDNFLLENDPVTYLKGNSELAQEVVDFLDGVKENIHNHICVNFTH